MIQKALEVNSIEAEIRRLLSDLGVGSDVVLDFTQKDLGFPGWTGLCSAKGSCNDGRLVEIDLRIAWGEEVFKQNLIDHGWTERSLVRESTLFSTTKTDLPEKWIVYACLFPIREVNKTGNLVPDRYLIEPSWGSVRHFYLPADCFGPEIKKRSDTLERLVVRGFSTTRRIRRVEGDRRMVEASSREGLKGGLLLEGWIREEDAEFPLISVVTVNYNGAKYLEQTLQSVLALNYPNVEYLVMDGGSKDESLEIIRRYAGQLDFWISEKDRGIYSAMNKGLQKAGGRHVLFMNSDDLFFSPKSIFQALPNSNVFGGFFYLFPKTRHLIRKEPKVFGTRYAKNVVFMRASHQAFFGLNTIKTFFDDGLRIIADWDQISRKLRREQYQVIATPVAIARVGGVSTDKHFSVLKEQYKCILKTAGILGLIYWWPFAFYCLLTEPLRHIGVVKVKRWLGRWIRHLTGGELRNRSS